MLTCKYNGKEMYYSDFIEDAVSEKEIADKKLLLRKLSDNHELHCKGCGDEVRLVDTEKKRKHFRHLKNSECTYNKFAKEHKFSEDIKQKFYDEINKTIPGQSVIMDKRLEDGTWVDIAFVFDNKTIIALNFIKRSFNETKMNDQHEKFKEMGIVDLWVIVGEPSIRNDYDEMFTKDALLLRDDWQNMDLYVSEIDSELTVKFKTTTQLRTYKRFHSESMPISAFSVNESGKIPYIEKIIEQKNSEIEKDNGLYNEEKRRKQEEQERKMLAEAEQKRKLLEKQKELQQELAKRKEVEQHRKVDKNIEIHQRTGLFLGSENEWIPLEKITMPKTSIQLMPFSKDKFEEKLTKAFNGYAAPIKELMLKLHQGSKEEKVIFLELMRTYRELPKDDERLRILVHIFNQSGLSEYIKKQFTDTYGPKLRNVLLRNNVDIDEEQFQRFMINNKNWIKKDYIEGRDDHILVAKYKKS
ncbi:competence protein CoiA [Ruminococcus albus]|uniref:Competence protein CoiA-like N-terminal domain-containing protein n=1 Tax=Ruminococcus albus (strain ATCC 27210 / DSM 20455 / JCM 14654 / NCDO 2250 / 7) TaxID=697329 RepID=E6UJT6_RUMA7|nr:hypothetical protein [Ruminococcus albus]ADU23932.1 hypothetical protein Rumal_3485 [Ruminococcus albus 7 = DSM 20455]